MSNFSLEELDAEIERLRDERKRMMSPEEREARDRERAWLIGRMIVGDRLLRSLLKGPAARKALEKVARADLDAGDENNRMWLFEAALLEADGHPEPPQTS